MSVQYIDLATAYAVGGRVSSVSCVAPRSTTPLVARSFTPVAPSPYPYGYSASPVPAARVVSPTAYSYGYSAAPAVSPSRGVVPPQAYSQVEESIVKSVNPLSLPTAEVISAGGHSGAWVNKHEEVSWRGSVPIQTYAINQDPCPTVIRKKPAETVLYNQEVSVKYLQPPKPAPHGDLVIRREANIPTEPAPPLVIRQQPPPPATPAPVVLREAPPPPPPVLPQQLVSIPGHRLAPAPRKVVVEKLPQLPNKPQDVFIERWLPYEPRDRRVVYQAAPPDPVVSVPKNVIVQWESPDVRVRRDFKNLGVFAADPQEYVRLHGASLVSAAALPAFVREISPPTGIPLAVNTQVPVINRLVGDVHALTFIDLEREGLGHYRSLITGVVPAAPIANPVRAVSPEIRSLSRVSFAC